MCRRLHIPTQLVLVAAVAAMLALEALRGSATLGTSTAWPVAQALVGASLSCSRGVGSKS